jgi:SsrA-binding protein
MTGKIVTQNRKATHDYTIEEKAEAGIVLTGTEIKSIRKGKMNLQDGYVQIKNGEAFLIGAHISPFEQGNQFNVDLIRTRKLLLRKKEISRLGSAVKESGYTLIPLQAILRNGFCKIEIGLAKGNKFYDKRQLEAKKDAVRQMDRAIKDRQKTHQR